jgi:type III restriction enzyme
MVVTVGAINKKDVNNLYKDSEKIGGEKPIDLIRATRPIVIVDEPQSVDGGLEGSGKQAVGAMNPLCTLRYSATHLAKHNMVYRLDAVDAYERKLVKQIEVASATVEDAHNKPYVKLIKIQNKKNKISATVELDVQVATGVQRKELVVHDGDDLEQTTQRAIYANFRIGEIRCAKEDSFLELKMPGREHRLKEKEAWGDVDHLAVHREMIRRTIREHLDKERRLRPQGIKVLSLFFIDKVKNYREYDAGGVAIKGVYAEMFEAEYARAIALPEYQTLFQEIDLAHSAKDVHDGYFSVDKKGGWSDTLESNESARENAERAYNLIMKDKEKLLSFETPLKFIFSHSALREGWDNPNVFQICALREMSTERERRQTIGRGLRLCVNQLGERVRGFEVNTLTVIARESYEQFAENLQKEIENDTGVKFGVVEKHQFASLADILENGELGHIGMERSKQLWQHLNECGYVDSKGKVQDKLKLAIKNGSVSIPETFSAHRDQIVATLRKLAGRLEVKNADERKQIRARQAVLQSAEFKALWDRIKHKTTYRVHFDNEKLLQSCIDALRNAPEIPKARLEWRKANISIGKSGVEATAGTEGNPVLLNEGDIDLPDVLTALQDKTQLTRRSICRILIESGRLSDFTQNPQMFIEVAGEAICRCKRLVVVGGIKYQRLGDDQFYAQELFEREELTGYMKNLMEAQKSVYEQVVYNSDTESSFAERLERNSAVKVYAKLPGWFRVPTPLGTYNPDWALLVEKDGGTKLYFVVETKGGLFADDMREKEHAKIECGRAHFKALEEGGETPAAKYLVANSLDDVFAKTLL